MIPDMIANKCSFFCQDDGLVMKVQQNSKTVGLGTTNKTILTLLANTNQV
jgi:hypothetical protein